MEERLCEISSCFFFLRNTLKKNNLELTKCLGEHEMISVHKCGSHLVDGATPIIIDGVHIANLFCGQVMFQQPDLVVFVNRQKNMATKI